MKDTIKVVVFVFSFILFSSLVLPTASLAQDLNSEQVVLPAQNLQQPADQTQDNQNVLTTNDDGTNLLNWWWLLPLVIIPFLFLIPWGSRSQRTDERTSRSDYRSATTFHDIREEDDEEREYTPASKMTRDK